MTQALILVLNCGSSSVKAALINPADGKVLLSALGEKINQADAVLHTHVNGSKTTRAVGGEHNHTDAINALLPVLQERGWDKAVHAVGHRIVHGGERFHESCLIDDEVLAGIKACVPMAPLHNPAHILGIEAAQAAFPTLSQVAVFDTAFHHTMPKAAYLYALPQSYYRDYGVRRYGFHGTSFRFVAQAAAEFLGAPLQELRLVIAHLGNGASVCAVKNGQSQDTSMGLTPLEGLIMGTRSGDIDASIYPFLADNAKMTIQQTNDLLNKKSGVFGVSGLSNDMRTLAEAAAAGNADAELALDMFAYRLSKYIAAMTVAAEGLDALVFTGGIGENAVAMRARTLQKLACLGLQVDIEANNACRGVRAFVSTQKSLGDKPCAIVIPTNEEWLIAQDTWQLTTSQQQILLRA